MTFGFRHVVWIVALAVTWGVLQADVRANKENIIKLEQAPIKLGSIETDIKWMNEKMVQQNEDMKQQEQKLDKIIELLLGQ